MADEPVTEERVREIVREEVGAVPTAEERKQDADAQMAALAARSAALINASRGLPVFTKRDTP